MNRDSVKTVFLALYEASSQGLTFQLIHIATVLFVVSDVYKSRQKNGIVSFTLDEVRNVAITNSLKISEREIEFDSINFLRLWKK